MEPVSAYLGTCFEVTRDYAPVVLAGLLVFVGFFTIYRHGGKDAAIPPSIPDPIPFVFNTFQFVFDKEKFMKRAACVATILQALANVAILLTLLGTQRDAQECPRRQIPAGWKASLYRFWAQKLPKHFRGA